MEKFDVNICRICLNLNGEILIFESLEPNSIADTIYLLTNMHIENYENLPDKICLDCMDQINVVLKLKKNIEKSEMSLKKCCLMDDSSANLDDSAIKSEADDNSLDHADHSNVEDCYNENESEEEIRSTSKRRKATIKKEKNKSDTLINEKDRLCKQCGKEFKCHANLLNHLRIHTGERPYECEICFKKFTQSGNLFNHKRSHTGDRPFICEICSKQFTTSGNLQQHMLTHVTERNYKCDKCSKNFRHKKALKSHLHLHSEVKNRVCGYCGKSFYMTNYLTRHIKTVHKMEKNFKCSECGKAFSNSSNLQAHFRLHTGEKPFECKYCDAKFNQSSPLQRHMQQHVKNNDKLNESFREMQ